MTAHGFAILGPGPCDRVLIAASRRMASHPQWIAIAEIPARDMLDE